LRRSLEARTVPLQVKISQPGHMRAELTRVSGRRRNLMINGLRAYCEPRKKILLEKQCLKKAA
jgi:hypothetical protein